MRIAIVTGASSGLGREFVKEIARRKNTDEIWIIARRSARLLDLAKEISCRIVPIPLDLTKRDSLSALESLLCEKKPDVRILEICSVAAFQPLPSLNVYAASKAFVCSFSRALRWELLRRGIHVTAVCPYWIKDTEFIPTAKKSADPQAVRHFPLASHARRVAKAALRDSKFNLPVSTPGPVATIQRILTKFIPHEIVIACWEGLRRI